jgi:hypothetical protein
MEGIDLIDAVEEDKYLRIFFSLFVEFFEDSSDDVFVHLITVFHHLVVVFDTLKRNFSTELQLHHFIDVELDDIFDTPLVERQELFLHGGRARYHVGSVLFSDLKNRSQSLLLLLEDVVHLVDCNELAVVELHVSLLATVDERFRHHYQNVSRLMGLLVHTTHLEIQLFRFFCRSELSIRMEDSGELILKNVGLDNDDSLRFEDFVLHHFSPTE